MFDSETVVFTGCAPRPLSSYLKAMGLFRIISEQMDSGVRAKWSTEDRFEIRLSSGRESILRFVADKYNPSPILDPWNGGSGFYRRNDSRTGLRTKEATNTKILDALKASQAARLVNLREVLKMTADILGGLGYDSAPSDSEKAELISSLRASLPDEALEWFDATVVMAGGDPSYPALLGTGGNDGNLDFANNFYQRLSDVFSLEDGKASPASVTWLESTLFGNPVSGLTRDVAIGQFNPGMCGGVNSTAGFSDKSIVNPWEFILMLEGVLVFSAAVVRRLESQEISRFSYPFTVRPLKAGYSSQSEQDQIRAEMWFPLWRTPASFQEISYLFTEGRATVGRRKASNSIDFAIATTTMGIDRGISDFERYGFMGRNGKSYFASPLGRFSVRSLPDSDILEEINHWQDRVPSTASANVAAALSRLRSRMLQYCKTGETSGLYRVLVEAGKAQATVSSSSIPVKSGAFVRPLQLRDPRWLSRAYDGSPEYRLAASLASATVKGSGSIRAFFEPVSAKTGLLAYDTESKLYCGSHADVTRTMINVLAKAMVTVTQKGLRSFPVGGSIHASLTDLSRFMDGSLSMNRFFDAFRGLLLLRWNTEGTSIPWSFEAPSGVSAPWSILKLVHMEYPVNDKNIPFDISVHRLAASGGFSKAIKKAASRLQASGIVTPVNGAVCDTARARRMVAALLFPISRKSAYELRRTVSEIEYDSNQKEIRL